ncbi:lipase family protein [Bacillus massiliglaciei]|uniref:lipase family protein n=1 Tax=Bacillus massiliglaciei TaxID=1816693 RepID=UPI000A607991|nr:hypothetical protein [Bacillus massiliglaciei]
MVNKVSDKEYQKLSSLAYYNDIPKTYIIKGNGLKQKWTLIIDKDLKTYDPNTGLDAAVYKKGNNVVVAFGGTKNLTDLGVDIKYVVGGVSTEEIIPEYGTDRSDWYGKKKVKTNQFAQSERLVKQVKEKYSTQPNIRISTTGHSLGGAEAGYSAAINKVKAVTFSAPNVVHLLPADLQKDVKAGKYNKVIVNYIHPKDSIGAGGIREWERHIGSSFYIGYNFEFENYKNKAIFPRFLASITGDKKSDQEYWHGLQHYKFDELGNLSVPELTNVETGERLWQSPNFVSADTVSIEVTPNDLTALADELQEIYKRVDALCDENRTKINQLNSIVINAGVQNKVLHTLNNFQKWFGEATHDLTTALNESADKYGSRYSKRI